jgi:hypothetical protein
MRSRKYTRLSKRLRQRTPRYHALRVSHYSDYSRLFACREQQPGARSPSTLPRRYYDGVVMLALYQIAARLLLLL